MAEDEKPVRVLEDWGLLRSDVQLVVRSNVLETRKTVPGTED